MHERPFRVDVTVVLANIMFPSCTFGPKYDSLYIGFDNRTDCLVDPRRNGVHSNGMRTMRDGALRCSARGFWDETGCSPETTKKSRAATAPVV